MWWDCINWRCYCINWHSGMKRLVRVRHLLVARYCQDEQTTPSVRVQMSSYVVSNIWYYSHLISSSCSQREANDASACGRPIGQKHHWCPKAKVEDSRRLNRSTCTRSHEFADRAIASVEPMLFKCVHTASTISNSSPFIRVKLVCSTCVGAVSCVTNFRNCIP